MIFVMFSRVSLLPTIPPDHARSLSRAFPLFALPCGRESTLGLARGRKFGARFGGHDKTLTITHTYQAAGTVGWARLLCPPELVRDFHRPVPGMGAFRSCARSFSTNPEMPAIIVAPGRDRFRAIVESIPPGRISRLREAPDRGTADALEAFRAAPGNTSAPAVGA